MISSFRPGIVTLCIATLVMACQSVTQPSEPRIETRVIGREEFPQQFDTSRTYVYQYTTVNADSLIGELVKGGLPVSRAWYPLDNECMGPIGPKFTVELERNDTKMVDFGFTKGVDRLSCATKLKQFIVSF